MKRLGPGVKLGRGLTRWSLGSSALCPRDCAVTPCHSAGSSTTWCHSCWCSCVANLPVETAKPWERTKEVSWILSHPTSPESITVFKTIRMVHSLRFTHLKEVTWNQRRRGGRKGVEDLQGYTKMWQRTLKMIPCQVAYPYIGNKRRHTKSAKIMWLNGDERRIFMVMTLFKTQNVTLYTLLPWKWYPVRQNILPSI